MVDTFQQFDFVFTILAHQCIFILVTEQILEELYFFFMFICCDV